METLIAGDLFRVPLKEDKCSFLSYICDDASQLNSNVVAACRNRFSVHEKPGYAEITSGGVEFYAHVVIRHGINNRLWEFYSRGTPLTSPISAFRTSSDFGNPEIEKSTSWWVWKIGQKMLSADGDLARLCDTEIGIVIAPQHIVERMETGKYGFVFPKF